MREFLKGLELDQETIDKIMAEYGKGVTKNKDELQAKEDELQKNKQELDKLKGEIKDLKESSKTAEDFKTKYEALSKSLEEQEAQRKAEEKDKAMIKNIENVIGDKKFINEYTKNAIINEVKNALTNEENVGKSTADLFNEITKDKEGIFENPNKPTEIPPVNEGAYKNLDKEAFDKLGYKERVALKQENPDLFNQLNN